MQHCAGLKEIALAFVNTTSRSYYGKMNSTLRIHQVKIYSIFIFTAVRWISIRNITITTTKVNRWLRVLIHGAELCRSREYRACSWCPAQHSALPSQLRKFQVLVSGSGFFNLRKLSVAVATSSSSWYHSQPSTPPNRSESVREWVTSLTNNRTRVR